MRHTPEILLYWMREIPSIMRQFSEIKYNDVSAEAYEIAQWYNKKKIPKTNVKRIKLTTYNK